MNSIMSKVKSKNMIYNNNKVFSPATSLLKKAHQQNIKSIQKQKEQQQQQSSSKKESSKESNIIITNNISKIPPRKYYGSKTRSANIVKTSVFSPSPPKKFQRRASPITLDINNNNNNIPSRDSYKLNLESEMFCRMEEEEEEENDENINKITSDIVYNNISEDDSQISVSTPIPSPPIIKRVPLDSNDLPSPLNISISNDIEEYRDVLKRMVQELTEYLFYY